MNRAVEIVTATFLFAIGGFIYVAFRCTSLRMFGWFDYLGLNECVMMVRNLLRTIQIPDIVKYCIPDGLWTLSYILFMDAIWRPIVKSQLVICSFIPVIGTVSEILQYYHVMNGTFDIVDLLCYLVPYVMYLLFKLFNYEEKF